MRNKTWRWKSQDQKIDTVLMRLDRQVWRSAWDVAHKLEITESIAAKYLRMAAVEDRALAEPPLNFRSIGALKRMYKLPAVSRQPEGGNG